MSGEHLELEEFTKFVRRWSLLTAPLEEPLTSSYPEQTRTGKVEPFKKMRGELERRMEELRFVKKLRIRIE